MSNYSFLTFKIPFLFIFSLTSSYTFGIQTEEFSVDNANQQKKSSAVTVNSSEVTISLERQIAELTRKTEQQKAQIDELDLQVRKGKDIEALQASFEKQIAGLIDNLDSQEKEIKEFQAKLNKKDGGIDFEFWMASMLTGVTLLLTIIGLGIAILSLFGFRNMLKKSAKKASEVASSAAKTKAEEVTHDAVDKQLIKYIEEGRFEKFIELAVEKQVYRGIGQSLSFDADEQ